MWRERDIAEMVQKYGVKNVRFFVPLRPMRLLPFWTTPATIGFTSSDDDEVMVECEIIETRYKVADGYKIQLTPVNSEPDFLGRVFGTETFYKMDLTSLLRRNDDDFKAYVLLDEPMLYQRITFGWKNR